MQDICEYIEQAVADSR